jgi:hypothetical protein
MLERIPADIRRVRARISVILLAAAVMASIAVATIRISDATEDHRNWALKVPEYGTTRALAAETRAKLKPPPGFKRSSDCPVEPETVCFARNKSLLLNARVMARLLAATGATLYSADRVQYGLRPIGCRTAGRRAGPRVSLSFQSCDAEAIIDHERLRVSANSAILAAHGSLRPTRRTPKGFSFPAEIHVYVIGHFLHEGTP